jgi:hypothetical protein
MTSPLLYEINTRCWLRELSRRHGHSVTLNCVPKEEFAAWKRLGFTHIWLMGVWTSGAQAREIALREPARQRACGRALSDLQAEDVAGSPYAVAAYQVPPQLGGEEGLADFRARLHQHGLKLLLDFVPNHVGLDHPWIRMEPDLFVQSAAEAPETFHQQTAAGARWLAHGKDPNFFGWTDTAQLDFRRAETRAAVLRQLQSVARRCDGVRCDMAMLLLREIFEKTWVRFPLPVPDPGAPADPCWEFWPEAIAAIKREHPEFLFLAEVYWDLEARLQQAGFDYTYDKTLYDRLISRDAVGVQRHLLGLPPEAVARGAHFLENHDEPRVATLLGQPQQSGSGQPEVGMPARAADSRLQEYRAAALVILGLPGMRFLHEGQLSGARIKTPVQLLRRELEPIDKTIWGFYQQLLELLPKTAVGSGRAELLKPRHAWAGNTSADNFVLVQWQDEGPGFDLVAVNLAPHRSQAYALLNIADLASHHWSLTDLLGEETYLRVGEDLKTQGLYLDLPPHGAQLFRFIPAP